MPKFLETHGLKLEQAAYLLRFGGRAVPVTQQQYLILLALGRSGSVDCVALKTQVWGDPAASDVRLAVALNRLNESLLAAGVPGTAGVDRGRVLLTLTPPPLAAGA